MLSNLGWDYTNNFVTLTETAWVDSALLRQQQYKNIVYCEPTLHLSIVWGTGSDRAKNNQKYWFHKIFSAFAHPPVLILCEQKLKYTVKLAMNKTPDISVNKPKINMAGSLKMSDHHCLSTFCKETLFHSVY